MKVLLINPPYNYDETNTSGGVNPPLSLMYLASYCKSKNIQVEFLDAVIEAPNTINQIRDLKYRGLSFEDILSKISNDTDLIGITNLFSSSYLVVRELITFIKKHKKVPIAIGGANPSAIPEYVLKDSQADFVIISEGEQTIVDVLHALHGKKSIKDIDGLAYKVKNKVIINPKTKFIEDLDSLPYPDRDFVHPKRYSILKEGHGGTKYIWTSILSSRGCPFSCRFCTSNLWKRKWRYRSAKDVLDEIELCVRKYNVQEIHFEDENLTLNKKRIIEICKGIIDRKLDIIWQPANGIRAGVTDKEILKFMKKSGCSYIVVAPESGSEKVLKEIINKEQDLQKVSRCVKDAISLCIKTGAYFIIGLPGETIKDVKKTIQYATKLARIGLDEIVLSPFTPLPGSELFDELVSKGKVKLNDEYFKSIFTSADVSESKSWSDHIKSSDLKKLKLKGYLKFHINRMIFHPCNFMRSIKNVLFHTYELKTERSFKILAKRKLKKA